MPPPRLVPGAHGFARTSGNRFAPHPPPVQGSCGNVGTWDRPAETGAGQRGAKRVSGCRLRGEMAGLTATGPLERLARERTALVAWLAARFRGRLSYEDCEDVVADALPRLAEDPHLPGRSRARGRVRAAGAVARRARRAAPSPRPRPRAPRAGPARAGRRAARARRRARRRASPHARSARSCRRPPRGCSSGCRRARRRCCG